MIWQLPILMFNKINILIELYLHLTTTTNNSDEAILVNKQLDALNQED